MKKEIMVERCLRCRYHEPSRCNEPIPNEQRKWWRKHKEIVLNEQARWVVGIHCSHYDLRKEAYIIPSTKGMKCKLFMEMVKL